MTTAGIPSGLGGNPHPVTAPLSDHHGIPPHQRIYREVQQKQAPESTQDKRTSLGNHIPKNQTLQLGSKTQPEKRLQVERQKHQRVPYSPHPQPFPCIGHHSPLNSSLALFFITDSSGKPITSDSPQCLPCCSHLF